MDYYFVDTDPCYLVNDIGVDIETIPHFNKHVYRE